jgi:hypothetical protein
MMDLSTKIRPFQRVATARLSWNGFLICAFAVMAFLAWATLRQVTGG